LRDDVASTGTDDLPGLFTVQGVAADVRTDAGARGSRWGIVVARFNDAVTSRLYAGAVETLVAAGAHAEHVRAVTVPGVVEVPLAVRELAETSHYAGIIALGCVIRGETTHYDYVCKAVTEGVLRVQLDHHIPVGFGVLTTEDVAQADARSQAGPDGHNVGADAARAVIELAALARMIRSS
jgi:6,7-dimethyl-8-ribityllumazine synthase